MSTVDCSRYQGTLTPALLRGWKAAGVTRVILKAGGGDSGRYQDSMWTTNAPTVVAAGLILEAYWFNGTTDPAGDAAFVLTFLPAGIRVWADVESEGSMAHWSDDQADTFERAVIAGGHPTGTYMSSSVTFGSWPKCSRRPLWVAAYGGSAVPAVGSWRAPVLWQYTSTGHLPGYSGYLDLDEDLAGIDTAGLSATPIQEVLKALENGEMKLITSTGKLSPLLVGPFGCINVIDQQEIDSCKVAFGTEQFNDPQLVALQKVVVRYAANAKLVLQGK
jgi:GH25 family lysozyme M1 (1,4-beta-N-acetylmuramidase)